MMRWLAGLGMILGTVVVPLVAQTQPAPLVTAKVDEHKLVQLQGSVNPRVRTAVDRGAVADGFRADRLLLLLNRPADRQTSLQQFLLAAHDHSSPQFHQWLTPQQFGQQFGPADSDVQAVTRWLGQHGLQVAKISQSKTFVEFSGTAGALNSAFHTHIHQFHSQRGDFYANADAAQVPAALAGVIRGLAPLNSLHAQPQIQILGEGQTGRGQQHQQPMWTAPNQFGTQNPYEFIVAPEDLATQYDLKPLYQAGVNGTGQTIGIIGGSNIDLSLVQAYQTLYGTGAALPQVIIDGDDPGDVYLADTEAYLDVEVGGAMAPKATVNLYIASDGALSDPVELAALRAVEDNQASVLSVSFNYCEDGDPFWNDLWEQAAAQGQTVLAAAGDTGPDCAYNYDGSPSVNGIASTPWNVAVGGTDFYYSDYASGGASANTLWSTTNDANLGSLQAPLPEQVWNDVFGLNIITSGMLLNGAYSGGGGVSGCATTDKNTGRCAGGYPKPSWQTGPGVPADGARDLPDVALYASGGVNLSAYGICAYSGECVSGAEASTTVLLTGGTSASTPLMAGIFALIDQKYGRQGQANYTLYALAQQKPADFHDITIGGNFQFCGNVAGPNCVQQANGLYGTPQYPAGPGYDLASGLGSVDVNALVRDWNSLVFQPTSTAVQIASGNPLLAKSVQASNLTVEHGMPLNLTATVSSSSPSGVGPTGNVVILTTATQGANPSQAVIPLVSGTGTVTWNNMPGGQYLVSGRYSGNGVDASSTSPAQALTVTPEPSLINFALSDGGGKLPLGGVYYQDPFQVSIQPTGINAAGTANPDGNATGSAVFTIDSMSMTVPLNAMGIATWIPPVLAPGQHTASASYAGDASFQASTAKPVSFTVVRGFPYVNLDVLAPGTANNNYLVATGGSLTMSVEVGPSDGPIFVNGSAQAGTVAPTGTVTFCLNSSPNVGVPACTGPTYSQTVSLSALQGNYSLYSTAVVTFSNLAAGYYMPQVLYNGDANWSAYGLDIVGSAVHVRPVSPLPIPTVVLSVSPNNISGTQEAELSLTVTGTGSTAPTGFVEYYANGINFVSDILAPEKTGATSTATFPVSSAWFLSNGVNAITVMYGGDSNYLAAFSAPVNLTIAQSSNGDFIMAAGAPQVTLQSGSSGSVALNLNPVNNFNGSVSFTCTPSSKQVSCSVNPTTVNVSGSSTATVQVTVSAAAPVAATKASGGSAAWPIAVGFTLFFFWRGGKNRRMLLRGAMVCVALGLAVAATGCGGGSTLSTQKSTPPTAPTYASVLVTGTANGIVHNARITAVITQ